MSDPKEKYHFSPPAPSKVTTREIVEKWAGQEGDIIKVEDLVFELDSQNQAELDRARQEARAAELEACIEAVKTLTPWLSSYHSNVSSEPTRKDIIEALQARKYTPQ